MTTATRQRLEAEDIAARVASCVHCGQLVCLGFFDARGKLGAWGLHRWPVDLLPAWLVDAELRQGRDPVYGPHVCPGETGDYHVMGGVFFR